MSSWRDEILKEFTPQVARLTLVADPDSLLLEEVILKGIEERGFELIPFEDHVAFRFAYESRYRCRWDRGELTDLVVVLQAPASDLRSLPYDLLQAGRRLSFNLGELFPNLSYPVIDALDRSDLDELHRAQKRENPDRPLGDRQTKGFVLRHVFGVAPETIQHESDLVRFLLRRHYRGLRIPPILDVHLVQLLRQNSLFSGWPLDRIVPDREAFFAFLQERWPLFLDHLAESPGGVRENLARYGLKFAGPELLPFDHDDVRVYLDNLFWEGFLAPVEHPWGDKFIGKWPAVGVVSDPVKDLQRRWDGLSGSVRTQVPDAAARHQQWKEFAPKWAQLLTLKHRLGTQLKEDRLQLFSELQNQVDDAFLSWVSTRYGTLHNHPPVPTVMVHHLPRLMARRIESGVVKTALVLVDGLSLDQWVVVREALRAQSPSLLFREEAVFAWIPTLTSVSRQACFSGNPPVYFPLTVHSTDADAKGWQRFWEGQGLNAAQVGYVKGLREFEDLERVGTLVSHPKARALGLVVDRIDRIMHGMELGSEGMHNQVRQWAEQGFLKKLLDMLLDEGFEVFLTSDHGNIEAKGLGRPTEGSVADLRGERVRVYPDLSLRSAVHNRFPTGIEWPAVGLPEEYHALVAPGRSAFVREGDKLVCHGGITVEEVMVPLVRIERSAA